MKYNITKDHKKTRKDFIKFKHVTIELIKIEG